MLIEDLRSLEIESRKQRVPIIGPEKGEWLLNFVKVHKPSSILELGTANGYSGIILGSQGANLITIESDKEIAKDAIYNFKEREINASIIIGDCVEVSSIMAKESQEIFDLIFIDFQKKKYKKVLQDCFVLLKNGGYLIADNISFNACWDYRQAVLEHPFLETEIIKVNDGLSLSRKL